MDELQILLETLYNNCKKENDVFRTQVQIMKQAKILKDKRIKELKRGD